MLYHISRDISLEEKRFIPRIPKNRLDYEDKETKRVCVSNSITNCISSFPYKNDLMWSYLTVPTYLSVYEVDSAQLSNKEFKKPQELLELVSDAEITQEYWILKEFSVKPSLIKIKKLNFSHHCKYSNYYHGEATKLEFEKTIENYDREEKVVFYTKRYYRLFKKICKIKGIDILEETKNKETMDYFGCIPSSRTYTAYRLTYVIPAGISAQELWYVISKEIQKYKNKHLVYNNKDFL